MSKLSKVLIIGAVLILAIGGIYFLSKPSQEIKNVDETLNMKDEPLDKSTSVSTPSGELKVEDLTIGQGAEVKSGDTVTVHYTGTLTDGKKFDSSLDINEPFTTQIGVGNVIEGWDEGIVGMKVGGKRKLSIPPELGYGDRAMGSIPPNSTLIFEVELLDVK